MVQTGVKLFTRISGWDQSDMLKPTTEGLCVLLPRITKRRGTWEWMWVRV